LFVAALDVNNKAYILEDATNNYTPREWAEKVVGLFEKYGADRIVAEKNQGGDMVRHTLETVAPNLPISL
jgi:phage terminase large subunit-like protein